MASPKRRSARLSNRGTPQRSVKNQKVNTSALLGSLIERDETPEGHAQPSIDDVLSTPAPESSILSRIAQLSNIKTPTSEPKPSHGQMHPHTVHQTTAKAPDSGLRLGFGNLPATSGHRSIASLQNTPSKAQNRPEGIQTATQPPYEFKFRSGSHLSSEAQQLMENLRGEAARIKEQMKTENAAQVEKAAAAEGGFQGFGAAGRKIARPKGKAGRFSDVHMAAFKKMDSIENHASAFRANNAPGFTQPTAQSLKRSPSKAGLDELTRPKTAGKGTPGRKPPPSRLLNRRTTNPSPFKSLVSVSEGTTGSSPVKRQRQSEFDDVSAARFHHAEEEKQKLSTLPRPVPSSNMPSRLLSPTKASLARSNSVKALAPVGKPTMLPRSQTTQALQPTCSSAGTELKPAQPQQTPQACRTANKSSPSTISKIPVSDNPKLSRPLPPLPGQERRVAINTSTGSLHQSESMKTLPSTTKVQALGSKLPKLSALKSILRPSRPQPLQRETTQNRSGTPQRPKTAPTTDSVKKVDFTPSVKSRYAVKLAAESPSPAKIHQDTPRPPSLQFDAAAFTMSDDNTEEEAWEDAEEDGFVKETASTAVAYPSLPLPSPTQKSPSVQTVQAFMQKAKEASRRESLNFKTIVAHGIRTSPENVFSKTAFNTTLDNAHHNMDSSQAMQYPIIASKPSPSTIRHVRPSDAADAEKGLEDSGKYLSHGLPAKKRRRQSEKRDSFDESKENRPESIVAKIPGGWEDSVLDEDEGERRGGKRIRVGERKDHSESPQKKSNPSREAAAKAAKDRKKKGVLSMSRLNMLARPREH